MAIVQEADFGLTDMALGREQRNSEDDTLLVRFFKDSTQDFDRTEKEGRPCFKEVDFIQISQPGNLSSEVIRPATMRDKARFPRHYAAYEQRNDEEYSEGTPLTEWPMINKAMVEELRYFKVRTVEQLAGMTDSSVQSAAGFSSLRQKAADWLEQAADSGHAVARISDLEQKMEDLMETIEAQKERIQELESED